MHYRVELQRTFFPPIYADVVPHERLEPGDKRLWTSLNIFVELRDDTTLYIPFREASKVSHIYGFPPLYAFPDPRNVELAVGWKSLSLSPAEA
jgi:hypothetical protein